MRLPSWKHIIDVSFPSNTAVPFSLGLPPLKFLWACPIDGFGETCFGIFPQGMCVLSNHHIGYISTRYDTEMGTDRIAFSENRKKALLLSITKNQTELTNGTHSRFGGRLLLLGI